MVIGPTPPGTGVIQAARSHAAPKSTSPTSFPSGERLMPTSITAAPGLTISPPSACGLPMAQTSTSARRAMSEKRGGDVVKFSLLDSDGGGIPAFDARLFALNEALTRLEELDPRAVKVVELRYFAGLTEAEAADVLGISVATLKRDWDFAKTWLAAQLA